jgi:uncharacterized spore protein YtfJ
MDPQQILTAAQDALSVSRVFGAPIEVEDATIVPVAVVRGGGAGGARRDTGGGAGFGLEMKPAGIFVVRGDDVKWRPVIDVNRIVLGGQIVAVTALLVLRSIVATWMNRRARD